MNLNTLHQGSVTRSTRTDSRLPVNNGQIISLLVCVYSVRRWVLSWRACVQVHGVGLSHGSFKGCAENCKRPMQWMHEFSNLPGAYSLVLLINYWFMTKWTHWRVHQVVFVTSIGFTRTMNHPSHIATFYFRLSWVRLRRIFFARFDILIFHTHHMPLFERTIHLSPNNCDICSVHMF